LHLSYNPEATFYDFPEIVSLLLAAGADINAKNFQGANVRETSVMSPKTEALFPVIESEGIKGLAELFPIVKEFVSRRMQR
jgi:hypothetical protein